MTDGDQVAVGVIQFDIGGHSKWAIQIENEVSRYAVFNSRKELQKHLQETAASFSFDMHHWAGDGGVFVGPISNNDDADNAYRCMIQMFRVFERWQQKLPHLNNLHCRLTGTYVPDMCIDQESGNWYHLDFNQFLKYERYFSHKGTIRITQSLRRVLRQYSQNFPNELRQAVILPDGETVFVFHDKNYPIVIDESKQSFRYWLREQCGKIQNTMGIQPKTTLPEHFTEIGDVIVLDCAYDTAGYEDRISFIQIPATSVETSAVFKSPADRGRWRDLRAEQARSGFNACRFRVHSFSPALLDDPIVRIEWSEGYYADSISFLRLIHHGGEEAVDRYLEQALGVFFHRTSTPNHMTVHPLVVFGRHPNLRILICHRRRGDRPGGFFRNTWSASFEEQFNPVEQTEKDSIIHADHSLSQCMMRGLEEELLGRNYPGHVNVSAHAFVLETKILNYAFIGMIYLPELTWEKLVELWPNAPDANEHDALASLPLRVDVISQCIASQRLPNSVFPTLQRSVTFDSLGAEDHAWHPTSHVRLAMAHWALDQLGAWSDTSKF